MKTTLISLIIVAFGMVSHAQSDSDNKDNLISIGHIDTLHSDFLGESRDILVYIPKGGEDTLFNSTYPVLYLLDGWGHFHSVTGLIRQLSTINGNAKLPKMIVVAIPNTYRTRDLTPTHVESSPRSGGGTIFLDFIEKELMPYIEETYPVANNKTFVGHSLGGLTVVNALLNRPHLFNNYIAIDPSLWWDDQYVLKRADSLLTNSNLENKSLYVGVANTLPSEMEYSTIKNDTSDASNHIRSILEFTSMVEHLETSNLNFKWKYYKDDTHGSVPLIVEHDGLRFMYSNYECVECVDELWNPNSTYTSEELSNLFMDHYTKISKSMGYDVKPEEKMTNQFGYWLTGDENYEKALVLFGLNIHYYPTSYNVYDSMGDCYAAQGDKVNAIKFFKKCLELGGISKTADKLKKLEEE